MHRKLIKTPSRIFTRLGVMWKKRFGVVPMTEAIADMTAWFKTPLGESLLNEEQAFIKESTQCLFGYHLLQLSVKGDLDLVESSRISHKFALHPQSANNKRLSGITDFNHLPLSAESMDAVLLHHVLDFSQSPHHLLREVARVIIPRGHLIIVGFNPWSLWGTCAAAARFFTAKPRWRYQYLRIGRLLDWLTLVDMEPVEIYQGFYRPPFSHPKLIKYLHWLEPWGKRLHLPWGGFYIIVARKDHIALTPIKPTWKQYQPLPGLAVTRIVGRVFPTDKQQVIRFPFN